MRAKGLNTRIVQLIDADDYDFKTGKLTYAAPFDRPYDWTLSGDLRLLSAMGHPPGWRKSRPTPTASAPGSRISCR